MANALNIAELITRRDQIYSELNEMTKLTVGGKPNQLATGGAATVDHVRWRLSLYEELKSINELIRQAGEMQDIIDGTDGSLEIQTRLSQ